MPANNSSSFTGLLGCISGAVEAKKDYLTELDAAVGDGDLGISLNLGFGSICEDALGWQDANLGKLLEKSGLVFGNKAPSTIGALFATGFLEASKAVGDKVEPQGTDISKMLESAVEGIQRRGKAKLGDKTLLDALIPATEAAREQARVGASVRSILQDVASSAERGAEGTRDLMPTKGRARWLRERSIGHLDPGAVAVAIVLRAAADWMKENAEG